MPNAHECAQLLIETIPNLMRGLRETLRQGNTSEDERLSMGQLRMLALLRGQSRTLGELASLHHVTPSTMSRTIDILVRKGLVARQADPHDRRQVILTLTEQGAAAFAELGQRLQDAQIRLLEPMIAQLDEGERARLYDGLAILRELVERTANDRFDFAPLRQAQEPDSQRPTTKAD